MPVTLAQVAALAGAEPHLPDGPDGPDGPAGAPGAAGAAVTGLAFDSRQVGPGSLFVALVGERVDGHDYVAAAAAAGAVAALTSRAVPAAPVPCLVVPDPVRSLGRIARDQVDRAVAGGLRVAAVTGSQGKTSTKDLLGQLLESAGPTVAPHGNLNTEVGLPVTVARLEPDTRYLVAEMGARGVGHIAYLCTIAPPEVGAVLNVGSAHVGEFGSVEAIATAKGELVEALPAGGVAVLNADDPRAWAMRSRTTARVVGFATTGPPPGPGWWSDAVRLRPDGCATFRLHERDAGGGEAAAEVALQVAGRHQIGNALAAAAVARALGLDFVQVAEALGRARIRSRWRMEMVRRADGGLVVNDAYNANPESMRAAIDTLAELGRGRGTTSWAVLGDMLELGPGAEAEHRDLGRYAAEAGIDRLVLLGKYAELIAAGAAAARAGGGGGPQIDVVADREAAVDTVLGTLGADDVVLVKASRGLALETVAERIGAAEGGADDLEQPPARPENRRRPDHRPTGDRT